MTPEEVSNDGDETILQIDTTSEDDVIEEMQEEDD